MGMPKSTAEYTAAVVALNKKIKAYNLSPTRETLQAIIEQLVKITNGSMVGNRAYHGYIGELKMLDRDMVPLFQRGLNVIYGGRLNPAKKKDGLILPYGEVDQWKAIVTAWQRGDPGTPTAPSYYTDKDISNKDKLTLANMSIAQKEVMEYLTKYLRQDRDDRFREPLLQRTSSGSAEQAAEQAAESAAAQKRALLAKVAVSEEVQEQVLAALTSEEGSDRKLQGEIETANAKIERHEAELGNLQRENELLRKDETNHSEAISKLNAVHAAGEAQLRRQRDELKTQLEAIEEEAKGVRQAMAEQSSTFKAKTASTAESARILQYELTKRATAAESEIVRVRAELTAKERELSAKESERTDQNKLSTQEIQKLQGELEKVKALQAENTQQVTKATQQVIAATAELDDLRESLGEAERNLALSRTANDDLVEEAADNDAALLDARQVASDLQQQLDDAVKLHTAELSASQDSFETLSKTIAAIYLLRDRLKGPMKTRNEVLYKIFNTKQGPYENNEARLEAGKNAVQIFNAKLSDLPTVEEILKEVEERQREAISNPNANGGGASAAEDISKPEAESGGGSAAAAATDASGGKPKSSAGGGGGKTGLAPRWAPLRF